MITQVYHHTKLGNSTKRMNASVVLQNAYDSNSDEETNLTNIQKAFEFIDEEFELPKSVMMRFRKFPQKKDDWVTSFWHLILYLEGQSIAVRSRYQQPKYKMREKYGF
jgi:hypothetical protein